jgi:GT2 family glycosyltransferase
VNRCDVVIATRNRPDALRRCLAGLRRQSVDDFGVIVVDDSSEPPLGPVVDEANAELGLDVTVITLPAPSGPAAGRNAGVAASTAEFVVFVDDDVYPSRHFVEAHLETVTRPHDPARPIVSCGPFAQPADWQLTPWNLWEARLLKKEADALTQGVWKLTWRNFHTGNNCVPRAVFDAVGRFDEHFKRAEDDELALRLHQYGCEFRFQPAAIAWHYANRTLDAWLAIPRAYAYYDVEIDRRHPEVGYLYHKKQGRKARKLPLRVARRVFSGPRRAKAGVTASVASARALHRVGATAPAMAALSMAYELTYAQALDESEAASGSASC